MECLYLRDFVFKNLVTDSLLFRARQRLELKKEGIYGASPIVTANKLKDMWQIGNSQTDCSRP